MTLPKLAVIPMRLTSELRRNPRNLLLPFGFVLAFLICATPSYANWELQSNPSFVYPTYSDACQAYVAGLQASEPADTFGLQSAATAIDGSAVALFCTITVFKTEIPRLVAFEKAAAEGVPVYSVADERAVRAWEAYEAAGKEIMHGRA
jgi:cellulose biosynthesis protein BcsQ